ncbi:MAG: hypothetical protein ACTHNT_15450 [Actinomycetales bacterium]
MVHPTRASDDPLAPLVGLPGVADAVASAQSAIDAVQWHRSLRRQADRVLREVAFEDAVASAALGCGSELDIDELRAHVRDGQELPPEVRAALRVGEEVAVAARGDAAGGGPSWATSPRYVLGRLHLAAAADAVPAEALGRPRPDAEVVSRLDLLLETLGATRSPALVVAAVVHGELHTTDAFVGDSGLVARGAAEVVLRAKGGDPRGVVPLNAGHVDLGASAYTTGLAAYASGTPEGMGQWLRYFANVAVVASRRADEIASAAG